MPVRHVTLWRRWWAGQIRHSLQRTEGHFGVMADDGLFPDPG